MLKTLVLPHFSICFCQKKKWKKKKQEQKKNAIFSTIKHDQKKMFLLEKKQKQMFIFSNKTQPNIWKKTFF